ncbi:MAG: GAF domain-containing protein, partial [Bacteroidales bacterium]|nr:GAF domain-containing protein [Bacteroidales bacterium]
MRVEMINRYKYIGKRLLFFTLLGMAVYVVILSLLVYMQYSTLASSGFKNIFTDFDLIYLTNLIPVLFCILGLWEGIRSHHKMLALKETIQQQTSNINRTIDFAREIGNGNLEYRFVPVNGEQVLGASLDEMRKSLLDASNKEAERNEIMKMAGQVGSLLRNNFALDKLSDAVISFLVRNLDNVVQGAIYVANEEQKLLEMTACYAYNRKKHVNATFHFAQGFVGQAAIERRAIVRTEIPDHYTTISSGLIEEHTPNSLLFVPLITNEVVYGVIELASFGKFSSLQLKLMEELSEIIARTIFNVKMNKKTYDLLQESQKMSEELGTQKTQLMEQAEEMIA